MLNQYPYTDFHDMNTDWVIAKIKDIDDTKADVEQLKSDTEGIKDEAVSAKNAAEYAQGKAEDAQEAAETAQGKAEDAQDAAEYAQGKAEDAQHAAEDVVTDTLSQINLLQARVDNIIPDGTQTVGNTELLDIRVDYDGIEYDSAGNAVRGQAVGVHKALENALSTDRVFYNFYWESGGLNTSTGAEVSSGRKRTQFIPIDDINNHIFLVDVSAHSYQLFFYASDKSFLNATEYYRNYAFNKSLGNAGAAYVRFTYDAGNGDNAPTAYKVISVQHNTDNQDQHCVITDFKPKYRLATNGTDVSEASTDISGAIYVHGYDFIEMNLSNNVHVYNTYDKNGTFLRGVQLASGTKKFKLLRTDYYIKVTLLSADYSDLAIYAYKNTVVKNTLSTFMKFGVAGDSLSVGMIGSSSRNISYSWGQNLARMLGNKCLNFGYSGVTVKTWQTNAKCLPLLQDSDNLCQCYIVGLGANNDLTIGTIADVNISDPSQNADTFYGNLGKDISAIRTAAPDAIIFMLTLPYPRYDASKNTAIKEIAAAFSNTNKVYLVDIADGYSELWESLTMTSEYFSDHFSTIGYHKIAEILNDAISNVIEFYNTDTWMKNIYAIPYGTNDVID